MDGEEPPREYPPFHEREDTIGVADQFEMITKFSMEQNLGHYGYGDKLQHLNKNLLFTNLSRQYGEPEAIQRLSRALTILSGHTEKKTVEKATGKYEKIDESEEGVLAREIFLREEVEERRFKRLETYIASKVFAITSTAAGTNLKLLETLKSTFLHKEQSIEDKTETKGGFWNKVKKQR